MGLKKVKCEFVSSDISKAFDITAEKKRSNIYLNPIRYK